MDYERLKDAARSAEAVPEERLDAAVKAVIGILVSRLDEAPARALCDALPEPLDFARLHGSRQATTNTAAEEWPGVVAVQFSIPEAQATRLVQEVLRTLKEDLPADVEAELREALPEDWRVLVDSV